MALKKCSECGRDISTRANSCPDCGANIRKRTGCLGYLGAAILIVIVPIAIVSRLPDDSSARRFEPQPRSSTPRPANTGVPSSSDQRTKTQEASIPSDVSFSIIDSSILPGIKRSLDVQLNKKVSEKTLRAIALKLKAEDSRPYDRTFIGYYLPGMTVGAGAWATTHFDPNLEVRILGLTAEQETELVAQREPANRNVIGRWLEERPFAGSRISIFRSGEKLFLEQTFKDGSSLKEKIVERRTSQGRRFDMAEGSATGDHWVVGSDGALQIRDNDGLIATARKIE